MKLLVIATLVAVAFSMPTSFQVIEDTQQADRDNFGGESIFIRASDFTIGEKKVPSKETPTDDLKDYVDDFDIQNVDSSDDKLRKDKKAHNAFPKKRNEEKDSDELKKNLNHIHNSQQEKSVDKNSKHFSTTSNVGKQEKDEGSWHENIYDILYDVLDSQQLDTDFTDDSSQDTKEEKGPLHEKAVAANENHFENIIDFLSLNEPVFTSHQNSLKGLKLQHKLNNINDDLDNDTNKRSEEKLDTDDSPKSRIILDISFDEILNAGNAFGNLTPSKNNVGINSQSAEDVSEPLNSNTNQTPEKYDPEQQSKEDDSSLERVIVIDNIFPSQTFTARNKDGGSVTAHIKTGITLEETTARKVENKDIFVEHAGDEIKPAEGSKLDKALNQKIDLELNTESLDKIFIHEVSQKREKKVDANMVDNQLSEKSLLGKVEAEEAVAEAEKVQGEWTSEKVEKSDSQDSNVDDPNFEENLKNNLDMDKVPTDKAPSALHKTVSTEKSAQEGTQQEVKQEDKVEKVGVDKSFNADGNAKKSVSEINAHHLDDQSAKELGSENDSTKQRGNQDLDNITVDMTDPTLQLATTGTVSADKVSQQNELKEEDKVVDKVSVDKSLMDDVDESSADVTGDRHFEEGKEIEKQVIDNVIGFNEHSIETSQVGQHDVDIVLLDKTASTLHTVTTDDASSGQSSHQKELKIEEKIKGKVSVDNNFSPEVSVVELATVHSENNLEKGKGEEKKDSDPASKIQAQRKELDSVPAENTSRSIIPVVSDNIFRHEESKQTKEKEDTLADEEPEAKSLTSGDEGKQPDESKANSHLEEELKGEKYNGRRVSKDKAAGIKETLENEQDFDTVPAEKTSSALPPANIDEGTGQNVSEQEERDNKVSGDKSSSLSNEAIESDAKLVDNHFVEVDKESPTKEHNQDLDHVPSNKKAHALQPLNADEASTQNDSQQQQKKEDSVLDTESKDDSLKPVDNTENTDKEALEKEEKFGDMYREDDFDKVPTDKTAPPLLSDSMDEASTHGYSQKKMVEESFRKEEVHVEEESFEITSDDFDKVPTDKTAPPLLFDSMDEVSTHDYSQKKIVEESSSKEEVHVEEESFEITSDDFDKVPTDKTAPPLLFDSMEEVSTHDYSHKKIVEESSSKEEVHVEEESFEITSDDFDKVPTDKTAPPLLFDSMEEVSTHDYSQKKMVEESSSKKEVHVEEESFEITLDDFDKVPTDKAAPPLLFDSMDEVSTHDYSQKKMVEESSSKEEVHVEKESFEITSDETFLSGSVDKAKELVTSGSTEESNQIFETEDKNGRVFERVPTDKTSSALDINVDSKDTSNTLSLESEETYNGFPKKDEPQIDIDQENVRAAVDDSLLSKQLHYGKKITGSEINKKADEHSIFVVSGKVASSEHQKTDLYVKDTPVIENKSAEGHSVESVDLASIELDENPKQETHRVAEGSYREDGRVTQDSSEKSDEKFIPNAAHFGLKQVYTQLKPVKDVGDDKDDMVTHDTVEKSDEKYISPLHFGYKQVHTQAKDVKDVVDSYDVISQRKTPKKSYSRVVLKAKKLDSYSNEKNSHERGPLKYGDRTAHITHEERSYDVNGNYFFKFHSSDGTKRQEYGKRLDSDEGPITQEGEYSYILPTGEDFYLSYVANEHGFHPQSDWLPVAPKFPHPIPDFVLKQIEKARLEDEYRKDSSEEAISRKQAYHF